MSRTLPNTAAENEPINLRRAFLAVMIVFVAVYSLAYSGMFTTDDEHILAAQALSFAFDDQVNFSRVMGNERVFSYSQFTDPFADQALNIEPAQAVIGSLLANVAAALGLGRVQALYLLNIWVTAITAAVIFLTVMRMGFSFKVGRVISAFFGLGTVAFPYSSTYFRDPLAMLFLACAWYFMYAITQSSNSIHSTRKQVINWAGLVISLAAGILAKNIILITVPVIFLALVLNREKIALPIALIRSQQKSRRIIWIVVFAVILLVCICWAWIIPNLPVLARFTPAYYSLLVKFFAHTPRPNFLEAVTGPLISPGKSIFIFSPILIISVWSLFFRFKTAWPAWACLMLMIVAQAFFYDVEWSGHVNWGLRYLLPAVPPLLLTTAPAVERLLKKNAGIAVLIMLGLISLGVQLLGVLVPVGEYYSAMLLAGNPVSEWSTIWEAKNSILLWNARWLISGRTWDLALARMPSAIIPVSVSVAVILGGVFLYLRFQRGKRFLWLGLAACLAMNLVMLFSFRGDPAYESTRTDFKNAQSYIKANGQPGDPVLIRSYGTPVWRYWMNWAAPQVHWTALPYYFPVPSLVEKYRATNDPEDGLSNHSLELLRQSLALGRPFWLVLPSDSPGADLGLEKKWLITKASDVDCVSFEGQGQTTEVCKFIPQPVHP